MLDRDEDHPIAVLVLELAKEELGHWLLCFTKTQQDTSLATHGDIWLCAQSSSIALASLSSLRDIHNPALHFCPSSSLRDDKLLEQQRDHTPALQSIPFP